MHISDIISINFRDIRESRKKLVYHTSRDRRLIRTIDNQFTRSFTRDSHTVRHTIESPLRSPWDLRTNARFSQETVGSRVVLVHTR